MKVEFDDFDSNPSLRNRLKERYKRIIEANIEHVQGKSILDLASNNGRWSYAACASGANKVLGIEGRAEKAQEAKELINKHGFAEKCDFVVGDMYDWLFANQKEKFETVFCLGVYYHILDHYMLLRLIARLQPECIIIDSGFVRTFDLMVHIQLEDPKLHLNALPAFPGQSAEMVGHVSLGMMQQMAWNCGYRCDPILWDPNAVEDKTSVQDYMMGRRYTLRLTKMAANADPEWKERWRGALKTLNPRFELLLDEKTKELAVDSRAKSEKIIKNG